MSRNLKIAVLLIVLAGFIGGSIGLYMFNKPHDDISSGSADYSMTATEIFSEFSNSEEAANARYLNKIIEVSGTVVEKSESGDGGYTLILEAEGEMGGVSCAFLAENASGLGTVEAGSKVSVRGVCTGLLLDVNLSRCVLM